MNDNEGRKNSNNNGRLKSHGKVMWRTYTETVAAAAIASVVESTVVVAMSLKLSWSLVRDVSTYAYKFWLFVFVVRVFDEVEPVAQKC